MINILGLAIGITCTGLLYLYINHEMGSDGFHSKADRIFRVLEVDTSDDQPRLFGQTAPPVAKALEKDYPEVSTSTRLFQPVGHIDTKINGERIHERNYYLVESNFFDVFDFEFIQGDPSTAFVSPNSMVISERTAKKYFGTQNPSGKIMELQNYHDATITGIVKDPPGNSHLQFDFLINGNPSDSNFISYFQDWGDYGAYSYLVLNQPDQLASLQQKSKAFAARVWADQPNRSDLKFQNIQDIYFNSAAVEFGAEFFKGEIRYMYLFGAVAVFLLLIACFNYINLATAQSGMRSKEIGIRKVSGAYRWQLMIQFFIESMAISLMSFIISMGLVKLLLPHFNQITGKQFLFTYETFGSVVIVLLIIALVIGFLSGVYPAIYLSRLKPSQIVKGPAASRTSGLFLRQGLVITQFSLSIIMIIATIVTSSQMNFIRGLNLGFDHELMAVVDINNSNVRSNFETMKYEFENIPGVKSVAASSRVPGEWKDITQIFISTDQQPQDSVQTYFMSFDEDMTGVYNLDIVEGKNFSGDRLQDSTKIMINEKIVSALELIDPVGKYLTINQTGEFQIIGVIKDFHFQSLHEDIAPLVVGPWSNTIRAIDYFSLKLSGEDLTGAIAGITGVHEQFDNTTAIELNFLDHQLQKFYQSDARAQNLFTIGACLTVFIACLGLFGLASFTIQRRVKEISIRKVLGATISNLLFHLSKSFANQIIVAFAIAAPVAWWAMYQWLSYFSYRISLGAGAFIWALVFSLAMGLLTIGHRAFRAATVNPAKTLKNE
ncbi:MAG: ABC transporter permease [Cyclobacteriaceae bacterium]|nr:MAG: ABC transporter permease [Cyclobacteriaceae bacterium]